MFILNRKLFPATPHTLYLKQQEGILYILDIMYFKEFYNYLRLFSNKILLQIKNNLSLCFMIID